LKGKSKKYFSSGTCEFERCADEPFEISPATDGLERVIF
jgi:hypothetical protein